jgi:protein-tyrosine phosphatase
MNANAIGIIGSIVDAHIAGCTEPKPCEACALDREAFDRLARLVEAAKSLLVVRSGPMLDDVAPYYRAVTELNDALSDVLGEGE